MKNRLILNNEEEQLKQHIENLDKQQIINLYLQIKWENNLLKAENKILNKRITNCGKLYKK